MSTPTWRRRMAERTLVPTVQPWHRRIGAYGADLAFKFANDCTMNLVSMVAFSVLTSFVSLILAVVLVLALLPGAADNVHFVSSLLLAAATTTLGRIMPAALRGSFSAVLGLAVGLFSLFLLLVAIYVVVPNMQVAWRNTWRGALVAAVALWLVNTAFPFYAAHFIGIGQYAAATIGTVIITITWVWFFALVLLIGAQINALSMGLAPWRYDVTRILMQAEGPFMETRYQRGTRRRHALLPFSGLVRDSSKVRPGARRERVASKTQYGHEDGQCTDGPRDSGAERP